MSMDEMTITGKTMQQFRKFWNISPDDYDVMPITTEQGVFVVTGEIRENITPGIVWHVRCDGEKYALTLYRFSDVVTYIVDRQKWNGIILRETTISIRRKS